MHVRVCMSDRECFENVLLDSIAAKREKNKIREIVECDSNHKALRDQSAHVRTISSRIERL